MKILFSPSETKISGGTNPAINKDSFLFPELFETRMEIVKHYQEYISNASKEQLIKLFDGLTMKAINRYDGVAFDYLEYSKLNSVEQSYIDKNVLIFSNLFGPINSGDFNYQ